MIHTRSSVHVGCTKSNQCKRGICCQKNAKEAWLTRRLCSTKFASPSPSRILTLTLTSDFFKKKFKKRTGKWQGSHACQLPHTYPIPNGPGHSGLIGMCRPDRGGIPDGAVCVVHAILRMFKAQIIISAFPASFKINNGARGHRKGLPRQAEEMLEGTRRDHDRDRVCPAPVLSATVPTHGPGQSATLHLQVCKSQLPCISVTAVLYLHLRKRANRRLQIRSLIFRKY